MNRLAIALAASSALILSATRAQGSSPQTPLRHFTLIQYNSPGDDEPITNAKLNAEWVTISNSSSKALALTGWHVRDAGSIHRYTFSRLIIAAHHSVRLHTGSGKDGEFNRYWGEDNYVWNNTGDTATLTTASGSVDDTCHWSDPSDQHNQIRCG